MSAPPAPAPAAPVARVVCVRCDAPTVALVREALEVGLPGTQTVAQETTAPAPDADCAVLQGPAGDVGRTVERTLRELRAGSFAGAVAVILDDDAADSVLDGARRLGVLAAVPRAQVARELPAVVATAMRAAEGGGGSAPHPAWVALRRVEHLVAVGEAAIGVRHALNNSLTGLLAEAQLLEMEPLPAEQHQAVRRIVELCRQTVAVARQLDAGAPDHAGGRRRRPDGGTA